MHRLATEKRKPLSVWHAIFLADSQSGVNGMEIWKDVIGYEGIYEVSNEGRVRSIDRVANNGRRYKGKVLSPAPGGRTGEYRSVQLFDLDGKQTRKYVHQLVARAFIGEPLPGDQVNHKDENKSNNAVDNLEWMTASENINYGTRTAKDRAKKSKPVKQIAPNGEIINTFASATEAQKITGIQRTHISACCLGNIKTAGGFMWGFEKC